MFSFRFKKENLPKQKLYEFDFDRINSIDDIKNILRAGEWILEEYQIYQHGLQKYVKEIKR